MTKQNKILVLATVLLIIILPFIYKAYSTNIQEKKEINVIKAKAEANNSEVLLKQKIEEERQERIARCTNNAEEFYRMEWDRVCKFLGRDWNCTNLPTKAVLTLKTNLKQQKEDCYNKYK